MTRTILLKKLRNGEERAFEHLFKTYYEHLVLFAVRFVCDIDIAREIVQDLFVSIFEKRSQLDINLSIKSYLYSAVRNRCLNHINSEKIKGKYEEFVKSKPNEKEATTIEQNIYRDEMEIALEGAIDKLPPKCKAIFKMNRLEGMTNSEIADKLSISKRTVETQISKALKLLRTELKPFLANAGIILWCIIELLLN